jgi:hypothetical protein
VGKGGGAWRVLMKRLEGKIQLGKLIVGGKIILK